VSQGVANLAAGVIGAMPVGGSFGRSSLNRAAGARTRWSGAITGVVVIAALPVASRLSSIPRTVLAAVVVGAVLSLLRVDQLLEMWRSSRWQAAAAVGTIVATLALDPRVDRAILLGLAASVVVHLAREMAVHVDGTYDDGHLHLAPKGVLWFGSINRIEERMLAYLADHPDAVRVTVDLSGVGRLDITAAHELADMARDAADDGIDWRYTGVPPHAERVMGHIVRPVAGDDRSDAATADPGDG
jgi:SulP family sulfate permease